MRKLMNYKTSKIYLLAIAILLKAQMVYATDVSGAIENTWNDASSQIKQVVDNVVFPAISLILAVLFFIKLSTSYFDYKKNGQFEFIAPAILFVGLLFALTAKLYVWDILGM